MTGERARGSVTAFDPIVGLGTVCGEDGVEYMFHCVEIADGSREIAVGTAVTFVPTAKRGRIEAFSVSTGPSGP